jgi:DNA-binding NtrC family response regulator
MTESAAKLTLDVLLVDDDADLRGDTASFLSRQGHAVTECESGEDALSLLERRSFDVVVLDLMMTGMTGIDVLKALQSREAECDVIVLTGEATIETAVEAMKLGAREYLTKPISLKELTRLIRKTFDTAQLRKENRQLKAVLKQHQNPSKIVGTSPQMDAVYRLIARVGPSNKPILIQGESGTGMELVARALHDSSPVADKPLVVINCAALPETLLESELFGYEKGAFTGAVGMKPGLFEVADGGTLFIDEIGELALSLQAKLLRVLEDGMIRRIGSVKERRVRVRLIAATNRDLLQEVQEKQFREDLYYRINVLSIQLPPLRQREGDLALLAKTFAGDEWQFDSGVVQLLERYSWPGNVRQLQNAIERAKILADDDYIRAENLPPEIVNTATNKPALVTSDMELETLTKEHVLETYRRHGSNKVRAAKALGIGRRTL